MPRILPMLAGGLIVGAGSLGVPAAVAQPTKDAHRVEWPVLSPPTGVTDASIPGRLDTAPSAAALRSLRPFVLPQVLDARSLAANTALSAALPGAGQLRLGQRRAWAYLALETGAWVYYANRRSAEGSARIRYRDFAWDRARIQPSTRVDGDFDYYETLSKWTRSGAWDADPGTAGVQPETDPSAFNGSIWSLADRIYQPGPGAPPGDPRLEQALAWYRERAYGPEFLWDWSGTGTARSEYAGLIRDSDARSRQATNALGVVLANHVVSAVDALLSSRGRTVPVEARFAPWVDAPGAWSGVLRVTLR